MRLVIIFLEIAVIAGLLGHVFYARTPHVTIIPLEKEVLAHPESKYEHFYEPSGVITDAVLPPEVDERTDYTLNTDNLRASRDYATTTPSGAYRIMVLGDSYVFGLYTRLDDIFTERLERLLNSGTCQPYGSFEVVNLGVPGYDIAYSAEHFRLRGRKYVPDLVVSFVKADDFGSNERDVAVMKELGLSHFNAAADGDAERIAAAITETSRKLFGDDQMDPDAQINILTNEIVRAGYPSLIYAPRALHHSHTLDALSRTDPSLHSVYISDISLSSERSFSDGHPSSAGHKAIAEDLASHIRTRLDCTS